MLFSLVLLFFEFSIILAAKNYSFVMAAGDSITAGLGARWSYTRPTVFVYEDCGVSFATGGDEDTVSIAKLIENEWGTDVIGKSYGSRRVNLCIDRPANRVFCPRDPIRIRRKADGYNVALTGSTAEALSLQFSELKKRIEEDEKSCKIDNNYYNNILMTLLIGANDLCMWDCRRPFTQLSSFKENVIEFLDNVYGYFGERIDVLVGEIPALEGVPERAKGSVMEPFAVLECPCAYTMKTFADRIELYNQFIRNLKFWYPSIIITKVLREEELKDWPKEMTSKLDAFHPSKWSQEYFAKKIYSQL